MNHKIINFVLLVGLGILLLTACARPSAEPALDNQSIINTAIAGTSTDQAGPVQATQASSNATGTAQAEINQAVQSIIDMPPTPTPAPQTDVYTLTEEELVALIDQSVAEATAASQQASTATMQTASDGTVTTEEIYATIELIYEAETTLETAEYLMDAYYDLYGEYAEEALSNLSQIEDNLNSIATSLEQMTAILAQGAEAASAAASQLNATATEINAQATTAQANLQGLHQKVQAAIQDREQIMLNQTPNQVPVDRIDTILQVHNYLDTIKSAMSDNRISPTEMSQIAQLASNAKAGLRQFNGPGTDGLSGAIDGLTRNLARGEWPQARSNLGGFEASLPPRPRR